MKEIRMFKLKRWLATTKTIRIRGIGDPLITLVKTPKEIGIMEKRQETYTYVSPISLNQRFTEHNRGKFGVRVGDTLVHKAFDTSGEAMEWANWNYKGCDVFEVIKL